MLQAAIVGLGRWGQRLVDGVQGRSARIRVRRGMVRHPAAAAAFAARHDIALTDDYGALLSDPALDAVILATPHTVHATQTVAAASAGKHVFCEKPLALALPDAVRAVQACADAGRVLAVGHDKRFWPSMVALREIVASGALGTLLHAEGHTSNRNAAARAAWRDLPAEAPAGGMTGAGVHMLDALVGLCGPVAAVHAQLTDRRSGEAQDTIAVLLSFANGISGTLATVRSTPFYWRAHLFGDRASAEAIGPTTLLVHRSGGEVERRELAPRDALRAELEAFADAAAGGAPFPMTADEMLATVAALEAIVESAAARRTVTVMRP